MHMFKLEYITNFVNGDVESGKVVVMAESHEQAQDIVINQLALPASRTRILDSKKIKPPCYQVEVNRTHPQARPNTRAFGTHNGPAGPALGPQRYHVMVEASNVWGHSETQAIRKVSEDLAAKATHTPARHNVQMSVECFDAPPQTSRQHPLEKLEFFRPGTKTKPIPGGRFK